MSHPPWMPFYIADYLKDTTHLTAVEHGAYLLLILHYWKDGGLPDDDKKLARIARLTPAEWSTVRETLAEFFKDGWKHKRIDSELVRSAELSTKRAGAANARWNKRRSTDADTNAMQMQSGAYAEQCHTQSQIQEESPSSLRSEGSDGDAGATRKSVSKASRIPANWVPDEAGQELAVEVLGRERARSLLIEFRDYWGAEGGQRARKVNWNLTWRNRVRFVADQTATRSARAPPQRSGPKRSAMELLAERRRREKQQPNDPTDHEWQPIDTGSDGPEISRRTEHHGESDRGRRSDRDDRFEFGPYGAPARAASG